VSVGADRSDRRRNRSRRLQDRLAQLDIGQRPEHEGSSACPSVQFLLQDHTRSSRYKGDLNSRYPPATARRPISSYDARRPNSPLGRTLSIVVIGAREPCHKHAELRHDASNFVVLKSPLTAHRGDRDRPCEPPPADRLRRFGLTSPLGQRFFISSDNRFLPAAVRRRPCRATEPLPFPAAVFRALAGESRSLSTDTVRACIAATTPARNCPTSLLVGPSASACPRSSPRTSAEGLVRTASLRWLPTNPPPHWM
jgi:hypothetical protein